MTGTTYNAWHWQKLSNLSKTEWVANRFDTNTWPAPVPGFTLEKERYPTRTVQGCHQEWETTSVLPVAVGWLIFYMIAITGSLTSTWPTVLSPMLARAVE